MLKEAINEMATEIINLDMTPRQQANFIRYYCEMMDIEVTAQLLNQVSYRVSDLLNK